MAVVSLHTMSGARATLTLTNLDATLGDKMEEIMRLFCKPYPQTWASLTVKSVKFTLPDSQPFLGVSDGDIVAAVFQKSDLVDINFTSDDKAKTMLTVKRSMSLRDVQKLLCNTFRQRFPLCANLKLTEESFDNFDDAWRGG